MSNPRISDEVTGGKAGLCRKRVPGAVQYADTVIDQWEKYGFGGDVCQISRADDNVDLTAV